LPLEPDAAATVNHHRRPPSLAVSGRPDGRRCRSASFKCFSAPPLLPSRFARRPMVAGLRRPPAFDRPSVVKKKPYSEVAVHGCILLLRGGSVRRKPPGPSRKKPSRARYPIVGAKHCRDRGRRSMRARPSQGHSQSLIASTIHLGGEHRRLSGLRSRLWTDTTQGNDDLWSSFVTA
jgi:hypothetical protein